MSIKWNSDILPETEIMSKGDKDLFLIANGDRRRFANAACQEAQMECERQIKKAFDDLGYNIIRAHPEVDPEMGHGFIETQAQGAAVLASLPKDAPLIVAEAVWQYSNHIAYPLWEWEGPVLIASNFDGTWPGLVGAAGLEACLTKYKYGDHQKGHSFVWSHEEFKDDASKKRLIQWLETGTIEYDLSHVKVFNPAEYREYNNAFEFAKKAAENFLAKPRILGIYDPLCMGMLNAAFDEKDMVGTGIQLRRLNQSELYARMQDIPTREAEGYIKYLVEQGFDLEVGSDNLTEITRDAVIQSGQMYGAMVRHIAEEGLIGVGIAYQLGLAKLCAASDLVEAMLNSTVRPPVEYRGKMVMPNEPIMCANEADMGCAVDQTLSKVIYKGTGLEPTWWETTQHDLRWGHVYKNKGSYKGKDLDIDSFLWAFELSGNTPAGHMENGWADMTAERQPYDYFPENGICTKGTAKSGEIIWSRVYIDQGEMCIDIGRGAALELPPEESDKIWAATTEEWPLMHAVTYGVSRDQMMAKHKSNHITVSYAPDAATANEIMFAKAAIAHELGFTAKICGSYAMEDSLEHKVKSSDTYEGPGLL
ncbi:fucose isomerase [Candidatus Poribacteria bacterium]|nr:fucose isomerase [Candidatus Poribacteria bacterium]